MRAGDSRSHDPLLKEQRERRTRVSPHRLSEPIRICSVGDNKLLTFRMKRTQRSSRLYHSRKRHSIQNAFKFALARDLVLLGCGQPNFSGQVKH